MVVLALTLILIAGIFQGTFILPMTLTKKWEWEHAWATFSLLSMLIFNWVLTLIFIPDIFTIYKYIPSQDILILILFGLGWSVGVILFGLGMDKLGMALGYPIIMGLTASLGALIPLIVFHPQSILMTKGFVLLSGMTLVIVGIILCAKSASKKQSDALKKGEGISGGLAVGLSIAIFSGILSCLPNVSIAFGETLIETAINLGTSEAFAGNVTWALFFTVGFFANIGYCLYLMIKKNTLKNYFNEETLKNVGLITLMAFLWIASLYLYGSGAAILGKWGVVVGWPLFISLSILVGNICGILRGEWKNAPRNARSLLNVGILILCIAVVITAISNSL